MVDAARAVDSTSSEAPPLVGQGEPQNYDVIVKVEEPESAVFYVSVKPERVQLSGHPGNTVTWSLSGNTGAVFKSEDDIRFQSASGRERLKVKLINPNTIVGTVNGFNENQTIYAYLLTVHFPSVGVALRIDPEVDNPPPPPT